ncbi:hypothetical protein [Sphingomonas rubra]|uniref:Uncharacterized protein n=1 Tax=Sphingomonas rubra TaxID=634430 RepID=A0A1I5QJ98_9SPHN|nr:hypothetical protein [Sphingomonas rubra]SFP46322.1 hypothetical protein SAMN04488241_10290 [Sphingomonas rubra]
MTDEPHMDETRPDQTVPTDDRPEPTGFGDLPLQPTGSGVADEQMAFEQRESGTPPEGTAGHGNTGVMTPPVPGGQPPVGATDQRDTRNTEF